MASAEHARGRLGPTSRIGVLGLPRSAGNSPADGPGSSAPPAAMRIPELGRVTAGEVAGGDGGDGSGARGAGSSAGEHSLACT